MTYEGKEARKEEKVKTVIVLLVGIMVMSASTTALDREAQDCAYKLAYRTNPYACANERTYAHCMACIDRKLDACKQEMMSRCGIDEAMAKDECSLGKVLSPRICAKEL